MKQLPLRAVFLAVFCNVLFGSAVPMIKLGYHQFNITDDVFAKILFAGIRFFLSGIIVFVVDAFIQRKMPTINKQNRICVVMVALTYTFLQYLFNYIGLSNTTGARGSVLTSTSAFISVIFAHFCYRNDRMNFSKIIGSIIGFTGVVLVCSANDGFKKITLFGEGFVIISATCFVIGSMINKKATQLDSSFTVTAFNLLIGGGLLAIIGIIGYKGGITLSMGGIFVLLYLIMVSSIGFTLWSSLLRKYPIGKLGVFNFIIPVSGAILSGLVLGENVFNLQYIFSFALISVGIITVNHKQSVKNPFIKLINRVWQ